MAQLPCHMNLCTLARLLYDITVDNITAVYNMLLDFYNIHETLVQTDNSGRELHY